MDIAILGGGPAGVASALTLRRFRPDLRIVLVDPDEDVVRVGESLPPSILSLFDYLGLREQFLSQGWLVSYGTESVWGSSTTVRRDAIFSWQGPGWHIDRKRFDQWFRSAAIAAGVPWRRSLLVGALRADSGWQLQLNDGQILCRLAVDATGRAARFARAVGARRHSSDKLVGTLWWFQGRPADHAEGTLVEANRDGWWYSAHLPDARIVAGFLTDSDILPSWVRDGHLAVGLRSAPHTAARLNGCRLQAGPVTRNAGTARTEPCADFGWLAAGDAALAFDPLASLGISHAMLSGIEAARAASSAASGNTEVFTAYADAARGIFADFKRRQQFMYLAESRWSTAPFWIRRHSPPSQ